MEAESETYKVRTTVGDFRIKKYNTKNYSGSVTGDNYIKLGGKNFCVELKWNDKNPTLAELQWIVTEDGGCELKDIQIKGEKTKHMVHLAFTILRKYLPTVEKINLLDNSKYGCILPNGKKVSIFINKKHFLFHGGTYYDLNYSARPIHESEEKNYIQMKSNYLNPEKKSNSFDFGNPILQQELEPIYKETKTWSEFFSKIGNMSYKCEKLYGWYDRAFGEISDKLTLPEYWFIDTFITIPYTIITNGGDSIINKIGGSKKKNKTKKCKRGYKSKKEKTILMYGGTKQIYDEDMVGPGEFYGIRGWSK
jgi:hypothetical protein